MSELESIVKLHAINRKVLEHVLSLYPEDENIQTPTHQAFRRMDVTSVYMKGRAHHVSQPIPRYILFIGTYESSQSIYTIPQWTPVAIATHILGAQFLIAARWHEFLIEDIIMLHVAHENETTGFQKHLMRVRMRRAQIEVGFWARMRILMETSSAGEWCFVYWAFYSRGSGGSISLLEEELEEDDDNTPQQSDVDMEVDESMS
jgi:hypothetical protein